VQKFTLYSTASISQQNFPDGQVTFAEETDQFWWPVTRHNTSINALLTVFLHFSVDPSHGGLEGNEIADKLAKKGTKLHTKETSLQAESEKKLLNHKIATKYKQEADKLATIRKWRDNHKIWTEYEGKPRKKVVANFRL
jgi:hypothetical protein